MIIESGRVVGVVGCNIIIPWAIITAVYLPRSESWGFDSLRVEYVKIK